MRSKTETGQALPGQDYMYPFGVIWVAPRYIPAGAVVELAGFQVSCTSTPTGIRETPNRYTADAKFCFWKNNKRMIIIRQGGIGFRVTYPVVVPNRAPFRQKSPGD